MGAMESYGEKGNMSAESAAREGRALQAGEPHEQRHSNHRVHGVLRGRGVGHGICGQSTGCWDVGRGWEMWGCWGQKGVWRDWLLIQEVWD